MPKPRQFHVSLRGLLGLVTLIALSFGALLHPYGYVVYGTGTAFYLALVASLIIATDRRLPWQRFCLGFAVAAGLQVFIAGPFWTVLTPAQKVLNLTLDQVLQPAGQAEYLKDNDGDNIIFFEDIALSDASRTNFMSIGSVLIATYLGLTAGYLANALLPTPPEPDKHLAEV